jgi:peptidoglycan/xylan/chitin deacetylase (PgdA/CDA1 family)
MQSSRKIIAVAVAALLGLLMLGGCALFDGTTSTSGSPSTSPASTGAPNTTTSPPTTAEPSTSSSSTTSTSTTSTTELPTSTTSTAEPSSTTTLLLGKNYEVLPTKEKVVALTFDAAYDPAPLKGILAALAEAGADATFFLTGEFVRDFPSYTKLIVDAGYPIGNHSYTHPDFTTLTVENMQAEIEKTTAAMLKLGVPDPQPLFRAPYGALNKRVLSMLAGEGYVSVYWTIDTLDWKTDRTPAQIRNVVLKNLKPGAIVLMHVGSKQELEVLPGLLEEIKARGYRFVNLRDALPSPSAGE